ncbi:MAG: hypothetical protein WC595_06660 [Candidatus Nanoarchaeia archaeon]
MKFNGEYARIVEGIVKNAGMGISPGDNRPSMVIILTNTKEEFYLPDLSFRVDKGELVKIYTLWEEASEKRQTPITSIEILNKKSKKVKFTVASNLPDLFM